MGKPTLIDAHTHIQLRSAMPPWYFEFWLKYLQSHFGQMSGGDGKRLGEDAIRRMIDDTQNMAGEIMVGNMDMFGIAKSVVCVVDLGLHGAEPELTIAEINEMYCDIVKKHQDRLILAVGVDPRRKNAVEVVERGVREWGARSLKLFPPAGFYPNDRAAYPLYEKCIELGIPVNFHTGFAAGPFHSKYAQPVYLDDVAADFPELIIHCTHTGYYCFMELLAIARARQNIVCDLAGWLNWTQSSQPNLFYKVLRFMMDMIGPGRIMFASDTGGLKGDPRLGAWVNAAKDIPVRAREAGIEFTDKEMADFYGGTASRILKL